MTPAILSLGIVFFALAIIAFFGFDADRSKWSDPDPWTSKDKFAHVAGGFLIAAGVRIIGATWWGAALVALIAAVGFEVLPRRSLQGWISVYASWKDIVVGGGGGVIGALVGGWIGTLIGPDARGGVATFIVLASLIGLGLSIVVLGRRRFRASP